MPLRQSDVRAMSALRNLALNQIRRIEDHLVTDAYYSSHSAEVYRLITELQTVIHDMYHTVGPTINAAERAAEEYHMLREELEEEYTAPTKGTP